MSNNQSTSDQPTMTDSEKLLELAARCEEAAWDSVRWALDQATFYHSAAEKAVSCFDLAERLRVLATKEQQDG